MSEKNMNNIKEERMKRERGGTPSDVLKHFSQYDKDIKDLIVIARADDGEIEAGMSTDDKTTAVGLLEIVKADTINYE